MTEAPYPPAEGSADGDRTSPAQYTPPAPYQGPSVPTYGSEPTATYGDPSQGEPAASYQPPAPSYEAPAFGQPPAAPA